MQRFLKVKINRITLSRVDDFSTLHYYIHQFRDRVSLFSFHQFQKVTKIIGISNFGNSVVNTPCMCRVTKTEMKHENGEFRLRGNANPSEVSFG